VTFILNPLNSIFHTFSNPATTSFAWVGAQDCEAIFLNDFRWSDKIIPWHDLLLLLEGQTVHLPAPKSHYAEDIVFERDVPIFCTGKDELVYIRGGVADSRETEMMQVRWKVVSFNAQIPSTEQVDILPCPVDVKEVLLLTKQDHITMILACCSFPSSVMTWIERKSATVNRHG